MADCGTKSGYRKGCRCDACTEAGQEYLRARREREARSRARYRARLSEGDAVVTMHGITGYQRGCRCSNCYAEKREADIARRESALPGPDWQEVAHLMVGAGVRRRARREDA